MSHVPSLLDTTHRHHHRNHHRLPSASPPSSSSGDNHCQSPVSFDDSSSFTTTVPAAPVATDDSLKSRNKRKNFQPRCISDDHDDEVFDVVDPAAAVGKFSSPEKQDLFGGSSLTDTLLLGELINSLHSQSNGTKNEQPLDLSGPIDQLPGSKQLSDLLLMKNIASLYPQLASLHDVNGSTRAHQFGSSKDFEKEDEPSDYSVSFPPPPPPPPPPAPASDVKDGSFEELLQLYNFNRDQYMKLCQQQQQHQRKPTPSTVKPMELPCESE